MTLEEAISTIETAKAECEWNAPLDYQIAFDMAIRALRKQTPTKLDCKIESMDIQGYEINDKFAYCPCCHNRRLNMSLDYTVKEELKYLHCPDCGQALDWSDDE